MNQRQFHQEGLLVPGRVHKLEAIPGWTWSTKLEAMWEAQLERLKKVVLRLKRLPSQTEEDSEAQEAGKLIAILINPIPRATLRLHSYPELVQKT